MSEQPTSTFVTKESVRKRPEEEVRGRGEAFEGQNQFCALKNHFRFCPKHCYKDRHMYGKIPESETQNIPCLSGFGDLVKNFDLVSALIEIVRRCLGWGRVSLELPILPALAKEKGTLKGTFLLTAPLFFTFLTSKFPTLFALLNFILWSGSFLKIPSGKRKKSENHPKRLSS